MEISTAIPNLDEFEIYLRDVFTQLARFESFPKYQLERRVDGFIGVFLVDILKAKWGWETEVVALEVPIKKETNNQSINIDYLLYRNENASARAAWLFVELKTDSGSIRKEQLSAYRQAQELGMNGVRSKLGAILKATKDKGKYKRLMEKLEPFTLDRPIELLYLVPSKSNMPQRVLKLTFEEISELQLDRYPKAWRAFCTFLVPSIES